MIRTRDAHTKRAGAAAKWLRVAHIAAATQYNRIRFARGDLRSSSGSTHRDRSTAESLDYIQRVFSEYLSYGELDEARLRERTVLELGPGDNLGVALLFVSHGARRVVCLDKFRPVGSPEREREIYTELRRRLDADRQRRFDEAVELTPQMTWNPAKVECIYGTGVQDAESVLQAQQFDFIISRAVLEEVSDPDRAFAGMHRLLRPGGMLLHKVDVSDYGTLSGLGCHPLEFLTIPDFVYAFMSDDNGRPNRRLLGYYRSKMAEMGYDARIYITEVWGADGTSRAVTQRRMGLAAGAGIEDGQLRLVEEIRPRPAGRFRGLSHEELLAAGLFLTAARPGEA